MMSVRRLGTLSVLIVASVWPLLGSAADDVAALFAQHCAQCHGPDRLGLMGPALLPENLTRLKKAEAIETISNGRAATQMPPFGRLLDAQQIAALVDFVYSPLAEVPRWGLDEINASRTVLVAANELPDRPVHQADPMNMFVVVELGDHHATILDGDTFEPLIRVKTRFALHGGPKYSPDGRFVYFASRDGWVSKFDMWSLRMVGEVRAGINTRNLAVSSDGRYAMVANYLPHTLVLLDATDLHPIKVGAFRIPNCANQEAGTGLFGRVYQIAAHRYAVVVAVPGKVRAVEVALREVPAAEYSHAYPRAGGCKDFLARERVPDRLTRILPRPHRRQPGGSSLPCEGLVTVVFREAPDEWFVEANRVGCRLQRHYLAEEVVLFCC